MKLFGKTIYVVGKDDPTAAADAAKQLLTEAEAGFSAQRADAEVAISELETEATRQRTLRDQAAKRAKQAAKALKKLFGM